MYTQAETYSNYILTAQNKVGAKWYITFLLAICAGAFIAIGGAASTFASATFTGSAASLIKGAVFPVGLAMVIFFGAELFTGNCLLIAPACGRDISVLKLLKNWGLVYVGNLVGAVAIAAIVVFSKAQTEAIEGATISAAAAKCNMNFGVALLKAIPCNILVCLAVWFASGSRSHTGKFICLFLPVFAFVVCGFEHSVANMYYLTAGMFTSYGGDINFGGAILNCLIPTTLGNILGGGLVAVLLFALYGRKDDSKLK